MKILIAEDDAEIRDVIREILEDAGHACSEAVDGMAAKHLLERSNDYQLLISDFRMPNMNGVELLSWCREKKIHFPVIFISAEANLLSREKLALSDCCASLLRKPIDIDDLLSAVRDASLRKHELTCKV